MFVTQSKGLRLLVPFGNGLFVNRSRLRSYRSESPRSIPVVVRLPRVEESAEHFEIGKALDLLEHLFVFATEKHVTLLRTEVDTVVMDAAEELSLNGSLLPYVPRGTAFETALFHEYGFRHRPSDHPARLQQKVQVRLVRGSLFAFVKREVHSVGSVLKHIKARPRIGKDGWKRAGFRP